MSSHSTFTGSFPMWFSFRAMAIYGHSRRRRYRPVLQHGSAGFAAINSPTGDRPPDWVEEWRLRRVCPCSSRGPIQPPAKTGVNARPCRQCPFSPGHESGLVSPIGTKKVFGCPGRGRGLPLCSDRSFGQPLSLTMRANGNKANRVGGVNYFSRGYDRHRFHDNLS